MKIPAIQSLCQLAGMLLTVVLALTLACAEAFATPNKEPLIDVVTGASVVALPNRSIRIASITLPETPPALLAIEETQNLLRKAFKPHPVEFEVLTSKELTERIRLGTVDAFIASSGFYWRMTKYGVSGVGTLISDRRPDPNNATALAFLVRAEDNHIAGIADLKGHVAASTFETAFMTHRIGMAEIAHAGEDPDTFFKQVIFTGNTNNHEVVALLDNKTADVAMVNACWLEEQTPEVQKRYRVLNQHPGNILCRHSTSTYPGVTMVVTQGAPPTIAHIIARTILSNPRLSGGFRWGVATDFRSVDNVYKLLKIENYAYLRSMTLKGWLVANWQIPATVAALLLGLLLHSWRASVLVHRRTVELTAAMQRQQKAQSEIRALSEQMEGLHKLTVIGQLSSMIAHELAQPLAVVQYYCESQRDLLKNKAINTRLLEISRQGIEKGLARTRDIVEKVRSYNRGTPSRSGCVDVTASLSRVRSTLNQQLLDKTEMRTACETGLTVRANKLEFELMLRNLMKNALEACNECPDPKMSIECVRDGNKTVIRVENSGRNLTEEDLQRIRTPLLSTKSTGQGLGVTIASTLAEATGGGIDFCIRENGGLCATLTLPYADPVTIPNDQNDKTEGATDVR